MTAMASKTPAPADRAGVIARAALDELVALLAGRGYRVIGPQLRDGAIVYDDLARADQLPAGWIDQQEGGSYRLVRGPDAALFGHVVGPHSWKRFLYPPAQKLWQAERSAGGFTVTTAAEPEPPLAFLGVRACELHAIAIQDRVFGVESGDFTDSGYAARRQAALLVAVNCGRAAGTCFCVSMQTGPKVTEDLAYDLVLTELLDDRRHDFLVTAGTARGAELLAGLPQRPASAADLVEAEAASARAAVQSRAMVPGVADLLRQNLEHRHWDAVAERCLGCANCTMVCPTCFCSTVEDVTDLSGDHAERWRKWDSCYTLEFSYIHGGGVRRETAARYRQWITHKLSSWHDQFGSSGCTGCGRCITWCPVGIDITAEARAIRDAEGS
ncbi:MAG: sulfite reductase subunit A [Candidatus Hydrogenedens sp.]|nr:sulfite reductase subunit A [Candidatus Hydrogenedens sp.]